MADEITHVDIQRSNMESVKALHRHASSKTKVYLSRMRINDVYFQDNEHRVVIRNRSFKPTFDTPPTYSIVLSPDTYVARSIVFDLHNQNHGAAAPFLIGLLRTGSTSIHIPQVGKLFTALYNSCLECRIYRADKSQAMMGAVISPKLEFDGCFAHVSIDSCGPYSLKPFLKARTYVKYLVVVVVCKSSGLVHFEVVDSAHPASYLMVFHKIRAIYLSLIHI